jgi:hypothetical protein
LVGKVDDALYVQAFLFSTLFDDRCIGLQGNIPPVPFTSKLNPEVSDSQFPGLCLQDSPTGVRLTDYASVFPNGINAAAS